MWRVSGFDILMIFCPILAILRLNYGGLCEVHYGVVDFNNWAFVYSNFLNIVVAFVVLLSLILSFVACLA